MKLLLGLVCLFSSVLLAQTTLKVAFLGNSYTFYNDLPSLVDSIANADGNDLIHDQNTPGGYTLASHLTNANSLNVIAGDTWDYVVLQEQSQLPSFPYSQVIVDVYPKAKILCDSIRSANECAIPVFFNTWGRLNGDAQWDSINTFEKMNNRLFSAYNHMANANSGIVSPVGYAFQIIYNDVSAVVSHAALYNTDGSHPSIYGSYLAACIFYNTLFSANSIGNIYLPSGITQNEADYLQQIAFNAIYMATSPIVNYTYPIAIFDYLVSGGQVTFNNTSQHAYEYSWSFGDNSMSTDENPVHNYAANGSYNVTLTATYCDRVATYQQTVAIGSLELDDSNMSNIEVYPNPTSNSLMIKANGLNQIDIINLEGKLIFSKQSTSNLTLVNLSNQPVGIYFLKLTTDAGVSSHRIVKK
ncbi:MAG: DUF4886 domain-containing protein [Crocinitomicaceae bacterium]